MEGFWGWGAGKTGCWVAIGLDRRIPIAAAAPIGPPAALGNL
ncbi:MAG: hypothetical protein VKK80_14295 [Prochlorothrix sp.]|nr:hypothetical protein [Prochlorothrix sp.]